MIARREAEEPPTRSEGIALLERFFRVAGSVDVDKEDLKRHRAFINDKIYDLLLRGEAAASANGRDVIEPFDLPITKGLQESIHAFGKIEGEFEIETLLDRLTARPPLDRALSVETEARLPAIAGGLTFALARSFRIIDPELKNPRSEHWERSRQIFDLLL
jgi:hypothetical protein